MSRMSVDRPPIFLVFLIRFFGVVAVLATVIFGLRQAVGFGEQVIMADFRQPARFVGDLKPVSRREEAQLVDGVWRTVVKQSPVMVDFKPLALIDRIKVVARLVPGKSTEILLGGLSPMVSEEFLVRPIYHAGLESLVAAGWTMVTDGELTLYQRKPTFTQLADFLKNPPPATQVATYFADWTTGTAIPGYVARSSDQPMIEHAVVLRGHHRLVTFINDETLDTEFLLQDMNREEGEDGVQVLVYPLVGGPAVAHGLLEDDGNVTADQVALGLRSVRVTVPGLKMGAYQIELLTSDDVFVRTIRTRQSRLAILGRVFLGDYIGYSAEIPATTLYVNGSEVKLTGPHPDSGQKVKINDEEVLVGGGYGEAVQRKLVGVTSAITSTKNNLVVETNGQLAFALNGLVTGLPREVGGMTELADLDRRQVDYVLTSYEPSRMVNGVIEGGAEFAVVELGRSLATEAMRFSVDGNGEVENEHVFELAQLTFVTERDGASGVLATIWELGKLLGNEMVQSSELLRNGRTYEKID